MAFVRMMNNPKLMVSDETLKVISTLPLQFQLSVVSFFEKHCIGTTTALTHIKIILHLLMKNDHFFSLIEMLHNKMNEPLSVDNMFFVVVGTCKFENGCCQTLLSAAR